jgi:hypothetical protein
MTRSVTGGWGLLTSRLRKNSVFRRNTAKSRLATNYASMESVAYTHDRTTISEPFLEIGVFPQPARGGRNAATAFRCGASFSGDQADGPHGTPLGRREKAISVGRLADGR